MGSGSGSRCDPGLIPWAPLARTTLPPEELLTRCGQQLAQVSDANDREGLMGVAVILAKLAFPNRRVLDFFGGPMIVIESPMYDEIRQILEEWARNKVLAEGLAEGRAQGQAEGRAQGQAQARRESLTTVLTARFGVVPPERLAALATITDPTRLDALIQVAATCPDLAAFVAALDPPANP